MFLRLSPNPFHQFCHLFSQCFNSVIISSIHRWNFLLISLFCFQYQDTLDTSKSDFSSSIAFLSFFLASCISFFILLPFFVCLWFFLLSYSFHWYASPVSLRLSSWCLIEYITKNVSTIRRITMHGKAPPMFLFCSLINEWENFIQYLCFPQSTQIAFDSIFFQHKYWMNTPYIQTRAEKMCIVSEWTHDI